MSFDSFLLTFNRCIQLRNVNEIFQSTIIIVDLKRVQLTGFYMMRDFTENYFRTDYGIAQAFHKDTFIFKKQSNIGSLKIS